MHNVIMLVAVLSGILVGAVERSLWWGIGATVFFLTFGLWIIAKLAYKAALDLLQKCAVPTHPRAREKAFEEVSRVDRFLSDSIMRMESDEYSARVTRLSAFTLAPNRLQIQSRLENVWKNEVTGPVTRQAEALISLWSAWIIVYDPPLLVDVFVRAGRNPST